MRRARRQCECFLYPYINGSAEGDRVFDISQLTYLVHLYPLQERCGSCGGYVVRQTGRICEGTRILTR